MAGKELTGQIDEGIKQAQELIKGFPADIQRRIVILKQNPNEVISRIQQVDGLIVEFEERS